MFRMMPRDFSMRGGAMSPNMGGIGAFQPQQPPMPPPRQDNLMNFTRGLGGGNFNNPNFRGQPIREVGMPMTPPPPPPRGGGFATTGQEFFRNQPRQTLPTQPPQGQQPQMPRRAVALRHRTRVFRNQTPPPGKNTLPTAGGQVDDKLVGQGDRHHHRGPRCQEAETEVKPSVESSQQANGAGQTFQQVRHPSKW